jgi:hypothetical protein
MNYVGLHSEKGLYVVGPFYDEAAAEAWGQQQKDDRWFVLPDIYVAPYGMLESNPFDHHIMPISVKSPKEFAERFPDGNW